MLTENVYTFIEEAGRKALVREDCSYFNCLLDFAEKLNRRQELERLFRKEVCIGRVKCVLDRKLSTEENIVDTVNEVCQRSMQECKEIHRVWNSLSTQIAKAVLREFYAISRQVEASQSDVFSKVLFIATCLNSVIE